MRNPRYIAGYMPWINIERCKGIFDCDTGTFAPWSDKSPAFLLGWARSMSQGRPSDVSLWFVDAHGKFTPFTSLEEPKP